jgi:hypothetical protein
MLRLPIVARRIGIAALTSTCESHRPVLLHAIYRVDVDTRVQQVDGCRMPDHVRADALGGDRRHALRRLWPSSAHAQDRHRGARLAHILDLFAEDNRLNVYAGKLEVRPPGAPTTQAGFRGIKGSDRS